MFKSANISDLTGFTFLRAMKSSVPLFSSIQNVRAEITCRPGTYGGELVETPCLLLPALGVMSGAPSLGLPGWGVVTEIPSLICSHMLVSRDR